MDPSSKVRGAAALALADLGPQAAMGGGLYRGLCRVI